MFTTVLVANRGEIARRVIRTLRALGIRSVAVYSDADAGAPHVREADVAVRLGPAPATQSYLDIGAVLRAARETGAQAIHPGYGFLSENAAFARACADAGIVFVGPGPEALEVMGDKIRAKTQVEARSVPTVPGFSAAGLTDDEVVARAAQAGFPLLVKPSAGGGGKGMQIVRDAAALPDALVTARRIAAAAFGDDTLLLERLIERPRHIEVQVLADAHGTIVHLGERECTLQRRHQKVIEEAPSPIIDAATRARLGEAACAAAASVDYRGAGTVEFLVAADRPDEFFFIEMNTRLQVEHPVTELVTGVDLVAEQLRVAAGEPLAFAQDDVRLTGHAIEARVYAEAPERGFLPATGDVLRWQAAPDVRTDAGVETGSTITADYDPMIAKVIAAGADRAEALDRLDAALAGTVVLGVDTNIAFLRGLLAQVAVRAGDLDTGLIDRLPAPGPATPTPAALQAAAEARHHIRDGTPRQTAGLGASHESRGVWERLPGWRIGGQREAHRVLLRGDDGAVHEVEVTVAGVTAPDVPRSGHDPAAPASALAEVDADGAVWVHAGGRAWRLQPVTRRAAMAQRHAAIERATGALDPELRAPMPGTVVAVHVADGAPVASGDRLVTIEAMKMEHAVTAPHDGVARIHVAVGTQVRRDEVLADVRAQADREEPHD
ncbi:biotin carboxylase N-terminal domain-containing protein [Microbacterium invictum]|uniref:biotin carboxylase n=1 Tax=Microbacterium invictum TaxID=515415 RepID=A0AA40SN49_9MICO|nr:acetyl-CoA/propionyl-CoA carboxylase biotin carboxyl carrier protein [Microbacterium invictum]